MKKSKRKCLPAALLGGLSAAVPSAGALEPDDVLAYSFGRVLVRPQFAVMGEYDSNLYYTSNEEVDDFITTIYPGVNVFIGDTTQNYLSLEYRLGQLFYAEQNDNDPADPLQQDLDRTEHRLTVLNQFEKGRFTLKGSDNVSWLGGVIGGSLARVSESTDRVTQVHQYRLLTELTPKTAVSLAGRITDTDYEDGTSLLDRSIWRGTAGLNLKAFSKTTFLAEVYYGESTTDENISTGDPTLTDGSDSEFIGGFLGAEGEFTPKLTGEIRVGYEDRDLDGAEDPPEGVVGEISLTHRMSEKTQTSLTYSRRNFQSFESNAAGFTSDSVTLDFIQQIGTTGKWQGNLSAVVDYRDYEGEAPFNKRNDTHYILSAALLYRIQLWLTSSIRYQFRHFDGDHYTSAGEDLEYDVHRVSLNLEIGY